jgi:hypothetical protein
VLQGFLATNHSTLPPGGEAPAFGVSGVEPPVPLITESVTVLGLLDPKMTALNIVKHLPNDTA